jgi:hypothetical protein
MGSSSPTLRKRASRRKVVHRHHSVSVNPAINTGSMRRSSNRLTPDATVPMPSRQSLAMNQTLHQTLRQTGSDCGGGIGLETARAVLPEEAPGGKTTGKGEVKTKRMAKGRPLEERWKGTPARQLVIQSSRRSFVSWIVSDSREMNHKRSHARGDGPRPWQQSQPGQRPQQQDQQEPFHVPASQVAQHRLDDSLAQHHKRRRGTSMAGKEL